MYSRSKITPVYHCLSCLHAGDNSELYSPWLNNGLQAIRIVDPNTQESALVATMQNGRYYPTIATMPDGNVLIVGGYQQVSTRICSMYRKHAQLIRHVTAALQLWAVVPGTHIKVGL